MQKTDDKTRQKILLVEDDVEISDMLKNFLETEQFAVVTTYDGKCAFEQFFAEQCYHKGRVYH